VSLLKILATLLVVGAQIAIGSGLWWCLRRGQRLPVVELLGMGAVLGIILSILMQQLTLLLPGNPSAVIGLAQWTWLLLLPMIAIALVLRRRQLVPLDLPREWDAAAFLLTALLGICLALPTILRTSRALTTVETSGFNADLVFLEALGQSVSRYGITDSVFLNGYGLRYHWLTYAWSGLLTQDVQAPAFTMLTAVVPLVLALIAAALAVTWARQLSDVRWVPLLAGLVTVGGAYAGAQQGVVLVYDSPSNGMGSVVLLAAAVLMTLLFRDHLSLWALAIAALLGFAAMAAKASHGAVLIAGIATVAVAACWMPRAQRWRMWSLAAVTMAAGVLAYAVLLTGIAAGTGQIGISSGRPHASTWQGLDPFDGPLGIALGTAALILAILPRWIGVFALTGDRTRWHQPELPFGLGAGLLGIGALILLSSGVNDAWFALAATAVLSVLSAVGVGALATNRGWRFWATCMGIAFAAGALLFLAFGLATISQTATLWRGPVLVWVVCLLGAFLGLLWVRRVGTLARRWWALAATSLVFVSVIGRISGPLLWDIAGGRIAPVFEAIIRIGYPTATFGELPERPAGFSDTSTDETPLMREILAFRDRYESVVWSPGKASAAEWVRLNVPSADVIATDNPIQQAFLPAVSGNRMLVSGIPYTLGYAPAAALPQLRDRLALVEAVVDAPTVAGVDQLRRAGVQWLWLEDSASRAQDYIAIPQVRVAFTNDEVTVLDLR